METLKVRKRGKCYLLFNLTTQNVCALKSNSQELSTYFKCCLETGSNICTLENEGNTLPTTSDQMQNLNASPSINGTSTSAPATETSTASTRKNRKFSFLCGTFEKQNYIYGIKFDKHPWHYFNEFDSMSAQHVSLPASVDALICQLDAVRTIVVHLNEAQSRNYFENGKFIFKNEELKTYLAIAGKQLGNRMSESIDKSTKRLVFISGQTNPLLFLNDFEKCSDVRSDKNKMYRILEFVDESHKGDFTKLYFTSDWASVKSEFLRSYSLSFAQNKKRES